MPTEDETKKYELTEDIVLKAYGLSKPKYRAQKEFNTDAVKREKEQHKGGAIYEWQIYEVTNLKTGAARKMSPNEFVSKGDPAVNYCATKTDNGIIVIKPKTLANKLNANPAQVSDVNIPDGTATNDTNNENTDSIDTYGTEYEVTGYHGDDEKLIQYISFIKKCLMKEVYESVGILL